MTNVRQLPSKGRAPICDLEAEAAVLSAILLEPERIQSVREVLHPGNFFADANRRIFEAILALTDAGRAVDLVSVATLLRDAGRLDQIGGTPYIAQIVDATPASANVLEHTRIVRDKHRARRAADQISNALERLNQGEPATDVLPALSTLVEAAKPPPPALPRLDTDAIFAPLPKIPWVCEALDLCPGAPALVAGYGYSGKTVALQSLALSVASGQRAWGAFEVAPGRVLHIDYEQGNRLTRERYQRLAVGMQIGPRQLDGRLSVSCLPGIRLDDADAEDVLVRELDGHTLCIIDSLRACAPSYDENSSDVRRSLDLLGRVSERTGCACVVIHHARKPQKDSAGGAKAAIRGSGAIFDACSSVLVFEASTKNGPVKASHEKARNSGHTAEDFELVIRDVDDGYSERAGLEVVASSERKTPPSRESPLEIAKLAIVEFLRTHGPVPGKKVLAARLQLRHIDTIAAVTELEHEGAIRIAGPKQRPLIELS